MRYLAKYVISVGCIRLKFVAKTLAICALVSLVFWSSAAGALSAVGWICRGSDISMLSPLYSVRSDLSPVRLAAEPEVTFSFEGKRPCSMRRPCAIYIKGNGDSHIDAKIKITSENITYCRSRASIMKYRALASRGQMACGEEYFSNVRMIVFGKNVDEVDVDPARSKAIWVRNSHQVLPSRISRFDCEKKVGWLGGGSHTFRFRTNIGGVLTISEVVGENGKSHLRWMSGNIQH